MQAPYSYNTSSLAKLIENWLAVKSCLTNCSILGRIYQPVSNRLLENRINELCLLFAKSKKNRLLNNYMSKTCLEGKQSSLIHKRLPDSVTLDLAFIQMTDQGTNKNPLSLSANLPPTF